MLKEEMSELFIIINKFPLTGNVNEKTSNFTISLKFKCIVDEENALL